MLRKLLSALVCFGFLWSVSTQAQDIKEYTVKRAPGPIVLDGKLNDPGWAEAPLTDKFIIYYNGNAAVYSTQAKMLWDNKYLYVGFINADKDVWAKTVVWTDPKYCLCSEEVVEVFIDPDGDGLNYLEAEINPFKAVMDLQLNKEISKGGTLNYNFSYQDLKIGITFQGTFNDSTDVDTGWVAELAFPFAEIAQWAPTMNFPPKSGDMWRLNLYRYNYDRVNIKNPELSAWTQTDKARGFHAPDRFSRVFFSSEVSGTPTLVNRTGELPQNMTVTRNFPNPFNPATTIEFVTPSSGFARLDILNVTGQKIRSLLSREIGSGVYTMTWDGRDEKGASAPSGVYFSRLSMGAAFSTHRMLLLK
ncbi:MAG: sugar-binding protein [Candidatus Latescibacter sp.]|nr:sugar-binding protein [Candidatus Latescibacter sp.]